jgi:hypothetical protein
VSYEEGVIMNSGMNGQQAGKQFEEKWERWLEDVTDGEKSWPMSDGRVNVAEFSRLSGISRNAIYKNPNLAPKIKVEIESINAAALKVASETLRNVEAQGEKSAKEMLSMSSTKFVRREDYEDLKRKYEISEQRLAVVEPAYREAIKRVKELELELSRYEFKLDTGFAVGPY